MRQRFRDDLIVGSNVLFYIGDNEMFADVEPKILIGKVSVLNLKNKTVIVSGYFKNTSIVVEFDILSWQLLLLRDYKQLKSDLDYLKSYCKEFELSTKRQEKFIQAVYSGPKYFMFNNELRRFYLPNEMTTEMYSVNERISVYTEGIYGLIPKYGFESAKVIEIKQNEGKLLLQFDFPIIRSKEDTDKMLIDVNSLRVIPWMSFTHMIEKPEDSKLWIENSVGVARDIISPEIFNMLLHYEKSQQA